MLVQLDHSVPVDLSLKVDAQTGLSSLASCLRCQTTPPALCWDPYIRIQSEQN